MGLGTLKRRKGSNTYSGYILRVEGTGFAEGVSVDYERQNSWMTETGPGDIGGVG